MIEASQVRNSVLISTLTTGAAQTHQIPFRLLSPTPPHPPLSLAAHLAASRCDPSHYHHFHLTALKQLSRPDSYSGQFGIICVALAPLLHLTSPHSTPPHLTQTHPTTPLSFPPQVVPALGSFASAFVSIASVHVVHLLSLSFSLSLSLSI
ncbi:unnamed protein product [Protopolystoma xenopodis]|uniref:Uncharacterized protein n=1 Tax=Protopolystoma xenopodis TaxID=117903 RepID=A0A3S5FGQ6_9PLAT|nr:unnamed protein product [Protopolystoma xenopodis]